MRAKMDVKVKVVDPTAYLPKYESEGAACFDFRAIEAGPVPVGNSAMFGTGLSFEIPDGHVMLIFSRSGHGFKNGIRLANCTGIIDSDYRGELKIKLHNDNIEPFFVNVGDRIAQGMIVPIPQINFVEVQKLSDSERGEKGFGSTGAQ